MLFAPTDIPCITLCSIHVGYTFSALIERFAPFGLQPEASCQTEGDISHIISLSTCSIIIYSLNQMFNSAVMQTDTSMENAIHV